jgi:hypothetical protein
MPDASSMLRAHPHPPANLGPTERCANACFLCLQTCLSCADACLAESAVGKLTQCIRLNLDCAEVCHATGALLLRFGRQGPQPLQAQVAACIEACRVCAEECRRHAHHPHCAICAEACQACHDACEEMLRSMRHAGTSQASQH